MSRLLCCALIGCVNSRYYLHLAQGPLKQRHLIRKFFSKSFRKMISANIENAPYPHFGTTAIHAGYSFDEHGSVVQGIGTSTTFAQDEPGKPKGSHEYSRSVCAAFGYLPRVARLGPAP
jgi:hypothetical protein